MYHKTVNSFPVIEDSDLKLPFFLRAVGTNEYQEHIIMPEGQFCHELCLCEEGEGILRVEGKEYHVKAGDVFFIRSQLPHEQFRVTNRWVTHFLLFGGFATEALFEQFQWKNHEYFHILDHEPLQLIFEKIYLYSTESTTTMKFRNSALIYSYIAEIYAQSKNDYIRKEKKSASNHTLMMAKRYIEQYYFSDLKLENVAEYCGVTPQHLCRLFQDKIHISPNNYLTDIRIRQAKNILIKTDEPIQAISDKVGFSTSSYFTYVFKKRENMTPSEYRILRRT